MFRGTVHGRLQAEWEYPDNEATLVYTLIGGPIVYVPMRAIDGNAPTGSFHIGAFRFFSLGEDIPRDAAIAAIVEGRFWWLAVLRYYAQSIPKRLLVTAYVWGLADYPMATEQTWRDVYVLRWVEGLFKRGSNV